MCLSVIPANEKQGNKNDTFYAEMFLPNLLWKIQKGFKIGLDRGSWGPSLSGEDPKIPLMNIFNMAIDIRL